MNAAEKETNYKNQLMIHMGGIHRQIKAATFSCTFIFLPDALCTTFTSVTVESQGATPAILVQKIWYLFVKAASMHQAQKLYPSSMGLWNKNQQTI